MKRFLCIVMTLCLCVSLAWAEELDYSTMTDEQLLEAFNSIRFELLKRSLLVSFEEKVEDLRITALNWTRAINVEEKRLFSESGWTLPDGAEQTDAKEEVHHYDQVLDHYEPVEVQKSRQVFDHNEIYYTYEDNGQGGFNVVQHEGPVYITEYYTETEQRPVYTTVPRYQTKYYYNVWRWMPSRDLTASGSDHNASWPSLSLSENEREGQRSEIYSFTAENMNGNGEVATYYLAEIDWLNLNVDDRIRISSERDGSEIHIVDEQGNDIAGLIRKN